MDDVGWFSLGPMSVRYDFLKRVDNGESRNVADKDIPLAR